jgi:hypothetical protein
MDKALPFAQDNLKQNIQELKAIKEDSTLTKQDRKKQLRMKLKEISENEWTILEDTLIDVEVGFRTEVLIKKRDKVPTLPVFITTLTKELKLKFKDEKDVLEVLLESIPCISSIRLWRKKASWKEEVEKRVKNTSLFSPEKRAAMIEKMYEQGMEGSVQHAKLWLEMSGELDKAGKNDPVKNQFERIQRALEKK